MTPIESKSQELVNAEKLRHIIWTDPDIRPCLKSIQKWTRSKILPHIKMGARLVFYNVDEVRAALANRSVKVRQ